MGAEQLSLKVGVTISLLGEAPATGQARVDVTAHAQPATASRHLRLAAVVRPYGELDVKTSAIDLGVANDAANLPAVEAESLYAELHVLLDQRIDERATKRIGQIETRLGQLEDQEADALVAALRARLPVPLAEFRQARAEYQQLVRNYGGTPPPSNEPTR